MELPIRLPSNEKENELQREIILIVNEIIEIKKQIKFAKLENELDILQRKVTSLENKVDTAVFCLYDITKEEKKQFKTVFKLKLKLCHLLLFGSHDKRVNSIPKPKTLTIYRKY